MCGKFMWGRLDPYNTGYYCSTCGMNFLASDEGVSEFRPLETEEKLLILRNTEERVLIEEEASPDRPCCPNCHENEIMAHVGLGIRTYKDDKGSLLREGVLWGGPNSVNIHSWYTSMKRKLFVEHARMGISGQGSFKRAKEKNDARYNAILAETIRWVGDPTAQWIKRDSLLYKTWEKAMMTSIAPFTIDGEKVMMLDSSLTFLKRPGLVVLHGYRAKPIDEKSEYEIKGEQWKWKTVLRKRIVTLIKNNIPKNEVKNLDSWDLYNKVTKMRDDKGRFLLTNKEKEIFYWKSKISNWELRLMFDSLDDRINNRGKTREEILGSMFHVKPIRREVDKTGFPKSIDAFGKMPRINVLGNPSIDQLTDLYWKDHAPRQKYDEVRIQVLRTRPGKKVINTYAKFTPKKEEFVVNMYDGATSCYINKL